jgi:hypothetical protein
VHKDYLKTIETSVKAAGNGITLAADALSLCECLRQDPGTDVRSIIDKMRKIAGQAHRDARDTSKEFNAIRSALLQVCIRNTISIVFVD